METFLMSNMAPQLPGLNQITWGGYETIVDHIYADKFEGVWVLTGPVFHPTQVITLKGREIEVPVEFWKIVIRRDDDGKLDAAGVVMTKEERRNHVPVSTFATTIDDIEARTNIDFFPDLAPAEEQSLESACPGAEWELAEEVTASFPGTPRPINEEPPTPRAQSLGTQVGHEPVCAN
jgi:endonuclease G